MVPSGSNPRDEFDDEYEYEDIDDFADGDEDENGFPAPSKPAGPGMMRPASAGGAAPQRPGSALPSQPNRPGTPGQLGQPTTQQNNPARPGTGSQPGQPPAQNPSAAGTRAPLTGTPPSRQGQTSNPPMNPPGVISPRPGQQPAIPPVQGRPGLPGSPAGATPSAPPGGNLPGKSGDTSPARPDAPSNPASPAKPAGAKSPTRPGAPGKPATPGKPGSTSPNRPGAGRSPAKPGSGSATRPGGGSSTRPGAGRSPSRPGGGTGTRPGSGSANRPGAGRSPAKSAAAADLSSALSVRTRNAMRTLPGTQNVKVKQKNRATPAEPVWVRAIQREMPPYADEVVAFALVGIGLFSFFTLLSPASGAVGSAWSGALRYAFGLGGFFISAAILAAGTIMLLPKLNVEVKLNWWRVLCGEIVFVLALAYFHALIRWSIGGEAGKLEAFARAFEGRGGGMVGWAIQDLIHGLLGDVATGSVLLILIVITGSMMFGVKRHQIVDALNSIEQRFLDFAEGMDEAILQQRRIDAGKARATRLAATLGYVYTARAEAATAAKAEEEARLAAMAGRPSLVTGGTGVDSTAQAPQQREINIRELARRRDRQSPEERAKTLREEVKMRFRVNQIADRKKLTKREEGVPPLEILDVTDFVRPTEMELNVNAQIIEETVEDFGMGVQVVGVKSGPTVTQYAVQPYIETIGKDGKPFIQRVRVSRVAALAGDLALSLAAKSVRIQAPVPGTNYLGIEVPNSRPGIVALRPVMESEQYFKERQKSPLAVALGREVDGTPFAVDLTTMPHLLIGGTTGSGKSVCITSLAACLIANNRPDQLKLVMIDPKMVELVRFNGVPHLLGKVEVELDRIVGVLRWVTREMERRYKLMEQALARNIVVYNQGVKKKKDRLPYMVVLIDELAELMTEFHDETEHLITRLAQMARATGIHLVVATQRPSTDVVTGLIKANFPSRIAFAVPSGVDSRVIIDSMGAEDLIGRGDMLYQASDAAGPIRLQGCFISDREMDRLVEFWQTNWHEEDEYEGIPPWEKALSRQAVIDETDDMLEDAIRFCQENTEVSTSLLQRRLNVGYPRAGRLMDALAKIAVVGPDPGGGKPRRVLIAKDVDPSTYLINWRMGR